MSINQLEYLTKKLQIWLIYENNETPWGMINWPLCEDIRFEIHQIALVLNEKYNINDQ